MPGMLEEVEMPEINAIDLMVVWGLFLTLLVYVIITHSNKR
jgi:hypothetical protein